MDYKISNGSLKYVEPSVKDLKLELFEDPTLAGLLKTPYDDPNYFTMYI